MNPDPQPERRRYQRSNFICRCTLLAALTLAGATVAAADTTLYSETFEAAHGWTLNIASGPNGVDHKFWTVSDNEAGVAPGGCATIGNGNRSLHVTAVFNPAGGAAYDQGGLCGILFCPQTNRRAESPAFSTAGQSAVRLAFDFISNGDGLIDNASVLYNIGAGWTVLTASIKSPLCPGGQGQWTRHEVPMPAEVGNQASVQIAINWTNNDDGIGSNPSVAINDVRVFALSTELFMDGFE